MRVKMPRSSSHREIVLAARVHLENRVDDRRLLLMDAEGRWGSRCLAPIGVSVDQSALADDLSAPQPVQASAGHPVSDLGVLELGDRAEDLKPQRVLRILLEVFALDNHLLPRRSSSPTMTVCTTRLRAMRSASWK
jgi:hypothetical protein